MDQNINKADLDYKLANIDTEINRLNDQKINLFFESIGLTSREDIPKDYLDWETILVVVPNRQVLHELKQYKYSIARIAFATNVNAKQIHIYDFKDWKNAFRNKTQLQIRNLLKTTFGGVKKLQEDYNKIKDNTNSQPDES